MLEVLPIQEKAQQESICLRCHVPYTPDWMAYAAYIDGALAGVCQFSMNAGGGHIYSIRGVDGYESTQTLFVMGRAALNFMDLCGISRAYCEDKELPDDLARMIGFSQDAQGARFVELTHFFDHPCQHSAHK